RPRSVPFLRPQAWGEDARAPRLRQPLPSDGRASFDCQHLRRRFCRGADGRSEIVSTVPSLLLTPHEKQRNTALCAFEWRTSCGGYDHGWSYLGRSHGGILEASLRALALLAVIAIGAPSPAAAQAT